MGKKQQIKKEILIPVKGRNVHITLFWQRENCPCCGGGVMPDEYISIDSSYSDFDSAIIPLSQIDALIKGLQEMKSEIEAIIAIPAFRYVPQEPVSSPQPA